MEKDKGSIEIRIKNTQLMLKIIENNKYNAIKGSFCICILETLLNLPQNGKGFNDELVNYCDLFSLNQLKFKELYKLRSVFFHNSCFNEKIWAAYLKDLINTTESILKNIDDLYYPILFYYNRDLDLFNLEFYEIIQELKKSLDKFNEIDEDTIYLVELTDLQSDAEYEFFIIKGKSIKNNINQYLMLYFYKRYSSQLFNQNILTRISEDEVFDYIDQSIYIDDIDTSNFDLNQFLIIQDINFHLFLDHELFSFNSIIDEYRKKSIIDQDFQD